MYENTFHCLTKTEIIYFNDSYAEKIGNDRDGISLTELREIIFSFHKFNRNFNSTQEMFEKCKKKIKEKQTGLSENEIVIRKK